MLDGRRGLESWNVGSSGSGSGPNVYISTVFNLRNWGVPWHPDN